jgi:hypothetical protein
VRQENLLGPGAAAATEAAAIVLPAGPALYFSGAEGLGCMHKTTPWVLAALLVGVLVLHPITTRAGTSGAYPVQSGVAYDPAVYEQFGRAYDDARTYEPCQSEERSRKAFDVLVLRPLGFLQVAYSAVMFAVSYPVGLATGTEDEVQEVCITEPAEQTFERSLGDL